MKAISYTRFSTPRQAQGDSLRRQIEAATAWCAENGVELDEELCLHDPGVTAWTGKNAKKGALATILDLARNGEIPKGTYLIVEALDRLTRMELIEAVPLLYDIVKIGLVLVTLEDGKQHTRRTLNNASDLTGAISKLARGHDESARKSDMVKSAFAAARETGNKAAFGSAPGWLHRKNKKSPWEVLEDRAESVRKVFELAASGYGSPAIARRANEEKWPVPTRDTKQKTPYWHARMAGAILRNRAVLGEHEHRVRTYEAQDEYWRGRATGIVVGDYYPPIVDEELWHRARAGVDSRVVPRRRDTHYFNIWAGLLFCGTCGAPMQRKVEYRGVSRGQLVCSSKLAGLTQCKTASAGKHDPTLLRDVSLLAAAQMGALERKKSAAETLEVERSRLREVDVASKNLLQVIEVAGALPVMQERLRELVSKRAECEEKIRLQQQIIATSTTSLFDDSYAQSVIPRLYERSEAAKEIRADCHTRLKRAVEKIWLWPYECALVLFKHEMVLYPLAFLPKRPGDEQPNWKLAQRAELYPPITK